MGIIDGRGNLIDDQDDGPLPSWAQLNHENAALRNDLASADDEISRLRAFSADMESRLRKDVRQLKMLLRSITRLAWTDDIESCPRWDGTLIPDQLFEAARAAGGGDESIP